MRVLIIIIAIILQSCVVNLYQSIFYCTYNGNYQFNSLNLEINKDSTFQFSNRSGFRIEKCEGTWKVIDRNKLLLKGNDIREGVLHNDSLFYPRIDCASDTLTYISNKRVIFRNYSLHKVEENK